MPEAQRALYPEEIEMSPRGVIAFRFFFYFVLLQISNTCFRITQTRRTLFFFYLDLLTQPLLEILLLYSSISKFDICQSLNPL